MKIFATPSIRIKKVELFLSLAVLTSLIFAVGAASAQGLARGYSTQDEGLKNGMAVVLSTTSTSEKSYVERATRENIDAIIGFSGASEDNLLTVASAEEQIYVQTTGVVSVFSSDINGPIKKGDKLTISPMKGILMRADAVNITIGSALEDFSVDNAEPQTISSGSGDKKVLVNKVSMAIEGSIAGQQQTPEDKSALKKLGESVVSNEVNELQVIIALVMFLIVMIAEGSIIYGAISSSMISVGRNPMAKNLIQHELIKVLGISVGVLIIGLAAIYFVLRI